MATYSFPALGFDPAAGDPDAVEAVASDCQRCARDLASDADALQRLIQHVDWQGDAATAFAAHPTQLHDDLLRASGAHGGAGYALAWYADALREAQLGARRLEEEAAQAKARADGHAAEAQRLAQLISTAPPGADTADHQAQQQAAQRLQRQAEDEFQQAVTRARAVERTQQEAGDHAASRIRALSDAPYHEPGLFSQMAESVAGWIDQHADLLQQVSHVLKTVSAIAGLLSFIPALAPICGPIALLTAGGALLIDAALVATGHGDWKALVVDAALLALPGAGRLVVRAVAGGRAGGLAAEAVSIERAGRSTTRLLDRADLTPQQLANYTRYLKKLPSGAQDHAIEDLGNGAVRCTARVPGRVPGSHAVYEKVIDSNGVTTAYRKTTVAPDGSIVHVKDKLNP